jgi:CBS domain-containing protein
VETSAISYRVADFLKRHPPFNAIDDEDLLELAARGRVRFYEPNQYILWQGEPHRLQLFVIQQGTVSLWDEASDAARLRDVRGAGDMLGIERYNDAPNCLCSVRGGERCRRVWIPSGRLRRLRHEVPGGGAVRGRRGPRDCGLSTDGRATRTAASVSP